MKTRIILIALLLTLGTQAFAQFGRPPHRHYDYYDYYDYYDPYDGPHGPIEYRWGRYYDQYGRMLIGKHKIDGKWYTFDKNGALIK